MGKISIDDKVHAELAQIANLRGVSADEKAETWLRESVHRHAANRVIRESLSEVAAMTPEGPQSDSVDLLREARHR